MRHDLENLKSEFNLCLKKPSPEKRGFFNHCSQIKAGFNLWILLKAWLFSISYDL